MKRINRVTTTLVMSGAMTLVASAQTPAPPGGQAAGTRPAGNTAPAATAPNPAPPARRSIVHHYPYPYPEYYHGDQTAGFRNPGGLGRHLEYYPAGNQFQLGQSRDPVRVARFDQGGGAPDRAEQLAAQQIGIARDQVLMNHIDNYARPAFGVGYFGGFY
jgi:hypothetical protein